jgi:hypothetical protein
VKRWGRWIGEMKGRKGRLEVWMEGEGNEATWIFKRSIYPGEEFSSCREDGRRHGQKRREKQLSLISIRGFFGGLAVAYLGVQGRTLIHMHGLNLPDIVEETVSEDNVYQKVVWLEWPCSAGSGHPLGWSDTRAGRVQ